MSTLKYKATERYSFGWTDPCGVYSNDSWQTVEPPDKTVRRILNGEIPPVSRPDALATVMRFDVQHASAGRLPEMVMSKVHDDNIYRVSVFPDGIDIICFGLSSIDSDINGHYDRSDDLPNWVKERLAVLMITNGTPPTQEVAGVGRRISSHVYWVYAPETTS
jgi:hypothetical protein